MPRRIQRLKAGGQEVFGMEQDFMITKEEWNAYELLDGGTIRLKTSIQKLYRVVDKEGQPQADANGEPLFMASHKSDVVFSE